MTAPPWRQAEERQPDRRGEELQVEPQAAVADVQQVVAQLLARGRVVVAVDLGQDTSTLPVPRQQAQIDPFVVKSQVVVYRL